MALSRKDCQTRLDTKVKDRIDNLKFVDRKHGYSKRIEMLLNFHDDHQKEYEKWAEKKK